MRIYDCHLFAHSPRSRSARPPPGPPHRRHDPDIVFTVMGIVLAAAFLLDLGVSYLSHLLAD